MNLGSFLLILLLPLMPFEMAFAQMYEGDETPDTYYGLQPPVEGQQSRYSKRIQPVYSRSLIKVREHNWVRGSTEHLTASWPKMAREMTAREFLKLTDVRFTAGTTCPESGREADLSRRKQEIKEALLCKNPFNEYHWFKDTPPYDKLENKNLSQEQARLYLLRFTKDGGYNEKDHQKILYGILGNLELRKNLKKELFFAVQSLGLHGIWIHEKFDNFSYADLISVPPYNADDACRSDQEKGDAYTVGTISTMKYLNNFPPDSGATMNSWGPILMYIPLVNKMPDAPKNEIKNKMYRTLATDAVESTYPGLFLSKALLFTKSHVNKLFGDPYKEFSEMTIVAKGDVSNYYLFGTSEIKSEGFTSVANNYGFESLPLKGPKTPKLNETKNLESKWTHNGESYSAKVKLHTKAAKGIVTTSASPDYDKMWADKQMSGVVLVGDNLGEFKAKATEHYVQYYAEKGYEFEKVQSVPDTEAWLKNNVSDGTVDYILKDAHSGGNTSNLVGFSKAHQLMKGTKTLADGKKEVVYILAGGSEEKGEQQKLSYNNMKEWMNQREKDAKGPLVYLNSACWSLDQARYEVPAIESPLFVDIAATSKTTTFMNSKNSTKYHIMDGLREGKSYAEMREGMKTTERYKKGTNQFKFPDEKAYADAFNTMTEVQIDVKDSKGKTYSLEDAAH